MYTLFIQPGRVRARVQVLPDRKLGIQTQSRYRRDSRPGMPDTPRPSAGAADKQPGIYGNGRAAGKLRPGGPGHQHHNGPQRTDVLTPAGDPFDRRARPADAAAWDGNIRK